MRKLIDNYIVASDSIKIGEFDDLTLLDFVVDQGETMTDDETPSGQKEGAAEAIENNIRRKMVEKVSGIRMNTYIAKKEKWTLTELEERNQYLMGRALEIWLTPSTEFKPEEKQLDSYTLDDANLSGRLIARFSYKNTEQPVTSWVEMFQKVLQILYAEDKNVITKLAASKEDNIALHFSLNETDFTKSAEIGDGIYVWTNTSTQSKLSVLSRVFKLYDVAVLCKGSKQDALCSSWTYSSGVDL